MNEVYAAPGVIREVIYSAVTLYMMMILLRWTSPFLSINANKWWFRWISPLTDPLLDLIRRTLPPMGFADWTPVAALLLLWVVRVLLVQQ